MARGEVFLKLPGGGKRGHVTNHPFNVGDRVVMTAVAEQQCVGKRGRRGVVVGRTRSGGVRVIPEGCKAPQSYGLVFWELEPGEVESPWQPIETAPKDGSEVLLCVARRTGTPWKMLVGHWQPGGHCIEDHPAIDAGWYFWNGSLFDLASRPTHWMPLPQVPA